MDVTLLWDEEDGLLSVLVKDWRTDEEFVVTADPDKALDVFNHPYAYR